MRLGRYLLVLDLGLGRRLRRLLKITLLLVGGGFLGSRARAWLGRSGSMVVRRRSRLGLGFLGRGIRDLGVHLQSRFLVSRLRSCGADLLLKCRGRRLRVSLLT
jgi:hypothetical protein